MVILINEQYREYFEYLDSLRASGETNMFGAAPFLAEEFSIEVRKARTILTDWMVCFSARSGEDKEYVDMDKVSPEKIGTKIMVDRIGTEVRPRTQAKERKKNETRPE